MFDTLVQPAKKHVAALAHTHTHQHKQVLAWLALRPQVVEHRGCHSAGAKIASHPLLSYRFWFKLLAQHIMSDAIAIALVSHSASVVVAFRKEACIARCTGCDRVVLKAPMPIVALPKAGASGPTSRCTLDRAAGTFFDM